MLRRKVQNKSPLLGLHTDAVFAVTSPPLFLRPGTMAKGNGAPLVCVTTTTSGGTWSFHAEHVNVVNKSEGTLDSGVYVRLAIHPKIYRCSSTVILGS